MIEIILIAIFVVVNGFFAASEIAVVTARRTRIKQLMEEGNREAKILHELREEPDRFLAAIQIGVTFAGAVCSAIGGAAAVNILKPVVTEIPVEIVSRYSEPLSIGLVVIVITFISVVFGELIPKSIALSNPEGLALYVAPIIKKFASIATVFVSALTATSNFILNPFGKKAYTKKAYITEEEVKMLIEEGGEQGVFEPEEKQLIHSVFEFTDTFVKEVMIPATKMVTVSLRTTPEELKTMIAEEKYSRYPVIGRDVNDIRGILYAKDFFNILARVGSVDVRKIVKPPILIPETMKISILLREMQKKRIHMAIAIDEYGAVSGLVTLEDVLEEIVGEIRDEDDTESPVLQLSDGSMLIDASISLRDLNEDYQLDIEESPEYETLGGYILTVLQRIPQAGDVVETDGKRLRVIQMVGQRIAKVKLEILPPDDSDIGPGLA
jgi:putative hemolysin